MWASAGYTYFPSRISFLAITGEAEELESSAERTASPHDLCDLSDFVPAQAASAVKKNSHANLSSGPTTGCCLL